MSFRRKRLQRWMKRPFSGIWVFVLVWNYCISIFRQASRHVDSFFFWRTKHGLQVMKGRPYSCNLFQFYKKCCNSGNIYRRNCRMQCSGMGPGSRQAIFLPVNVCILGDSCRISGFRVIQLDFAKGWRHLLQLLCQWGLMAVWIVFSVCLFRVWVLLGGHVTFLNY